MAISEMHPIHRFESWQVWPGSYDNKFIPGLYPHKNNSGLLLINRHPSHPWGPVLQEKSGKFWSGMGMIISGRKRIILHLSMRAQHGREPIILFPWDRFLNILLNPSNLRQGGGFLPRQSRFKTRIGELFFMIQSRRPKKILNPTLNVPNVP